MVDRRIQQALNQVLSPVFDRNFSRSSYGFRPGRSAHQAVRQAQAYVARGKRWLVDIVDLEKFLDRVNHDILMSRVARRISDKRVRLLIRRYLQAGIMQGGLMTSHLQPRLKVAKASVKRIREKLKENFRRGRGRRLDRFIEQELTPILRAGEITFSSLRSRGRSKR